MRERGQDRVEHLRPPYGAVWSRRGVLTSGRIRPSVERGDTLRDLLNTPPAYGAIWSRGLLV
jgi:hypothetical protein